MTGIDQNPERGIDQNYYDLLVVGSTPGGICSAVCAARQGLRVLLTTHSHYLGGMLSSGLGVWDTCYEGTRAPLVEEFKARIRNFYRERYGNESEQYQTYVRTLSLEPHAAEHVFNALVQEQNNITVLKNILPIAIERSEYRVHAVIFQSMDEAETVRIEARCFVDSTYEGDLAAVAGVPYRVGREARDEFGEPHAGRIFTQFTYGLFPYEAAIGRLNLRPFDLNSLGVYSGSTGEGDEAIQAYNFRITLCNDPDNRAPIRKPGGYDRSTYLVLLMNEEERQDIEFPFRSTWLIQDIKDFQFRNWKTMPNRKLSWNHGSYIGQNHAYPRADWKTRQEILQRHKDFDLGLLYFLQNDEAVPLEVRNRALEWGLARDEYVDNGNFPYEIYVREARRFRGQYVFTEHDASIASGLGRAPIHEDSIAVTEWPMDSHECRMERQPGSASDGMVLLNEKTRPAQVPYRVLLTHEFENLILGVCVSATHVGWGTIRVEPTMMHIGEAIGHAIALAHEQKIAPVHLSVPALQQQLVEAGVMISFFNDFDMATSAAWAQAVQFLGTRGFFPSYNARPEAPLDVDTMKAWLRLMGELIDGRADVNEHARRLHALPQHSTLPVAKSAFLNAWTAELNYRGLQELATQVNDSSSEKLQAESITIGHASMIIYHTLQQAPIIQA